jgi:hypothetical protein
MTWVFTWFTVALAAVVVINFVVQLAIGRIEGFVTRSMIVIGSAVVVLGLATAAVAIVDAVA